MESVLLGWPSDGPTLRLDYRRFSYAGKFVMSNTGKAIVRDSEAERTDADRTATDGDSEKPDGKFDDNVLAAVAFNADRTDPGTLWLRYVTVREDRRGEGLGPKLCRFVVEKAAIRGYDRIRIAVNNPFAYEALYRSGFAFTGETTGIAELVLERPADSPADQSTQTYQAGLDEYRKRDLSAEERAFLDARRGREPPRPNG